MHLIEAQGICPIDAVSCKATGAGMIGKGYLRRCKPYQPPASEALDRHYIALGRREAEEVPP